MTDILEPMCTKCTHFKPKKDAWGCEAFPLKIPEEILASEFDHHNPYPGDNGIQFKKKEE